jgi:hypothetical protein
LTVNQMNTAKAAACEKRVKLMFMASP